MTDVQTICATIAICWGLTLAVVVYGIKRTAGKVNVDIGKHISIGTGDRK